jgi:outer membrane protein, heavy metal efflux system
MSFPKLGAFVACVSYALACPAFAAEQKTVPVRRLIERALERNPRLAAAREAARAEEARPGTLAALPDPVLSWEAWNTPESLAPNRADNNIFKIAQRFPYPGKLASLAGEVREAAAVAREEIAARELDVVAAVKRAYAELWQIEERLRVHARDRELSRRLAAVAEHRYGVGGASQSDVLRAHTEATRLANVVETDAIERDAVVARLNALTADPPETPIAQAEEPSALRLPTDARDLVRRALEHRPDLLGKRAAIRRAEAALGAARIAGRPDFELSFSRFVNHDSRDGFGAMASVTLPFAWREKYDAAITVEDRRLAAARSELRAAEDLAASEVVQALAMARAAHRRRELYLAAHLPQAEQAMRVSLAGFETGTLAFSDWMESFRDVERIHLEHVEASAEVGVAVADLERAVGADLTDLALPSHPAAHSAAKEQAK